MALKIIALHLRLSKIEFTDYSQHPNPFPSYLSWVNKNHVHPSVGMAYFFQTRQTVHIKVHLLSSCCYKIYLV